MKLISIITACYNEEENIAEVYRQVSDIFANQLSMYSYEHVFIDNASKDKTVDILKEIAAQDKNVKIIVNSRNFGHVRSPFHGMMQCSGDAVISLVADLQDPPEMIMQFVKKWEEGHKIVIGVKEQSYESKWMYKIRGVYYDLLHRLSEIEIYKDFTGFGLYDKKIINFLKDFKDPYPFFRGMIAELGYDVSKIPYKQPARKGGITKNNFYSLYDMAILGIVNNSKVPLRLAIFTGFLVSVLSFFVGLMYLILKLVFWETVSFGIGPIIVGGALANGVLLFFLGIIGEYIGAIYTHVLQRPWVFEAERINFQENSEESHKHTDHKEVNELRHE